jgi:hypothetical protein
VTRGWPRVRVPVLSTATTRTRARASRKAPPLTRMPSRAARVTAATTAVGTEMTSAHEQETTSTTSPRYSHVRGSPASSPTVATRAARANMTGV